MALKHLSATDARARHLDGAVLIDVRSTREYAAGHPAGALHVPVLEHVTHEVVVLLHRTLFPGKPMPASPGARAAMPGRET